MDEVGAVHELPGDAPLPEGQEEAPHGVGAAAVVRWSIVAAVALIAAATLALTLLFGGDGAREASSRVPMAPAPPMGHEQHARVPGLAPLSLARERIQTSGIRTSRAVRKVLTTEISAAGVLAANERKLAEVTARVPGWVSTRRMAAVGDRVREGQVLGTIESPEILAASRELLSLGRLEGVPGLEGVDLRAPVRRRLEVLGLPQREIRRIEQAGQETGRVPIVSPADGVVIERAALPGSYVDRGARLLQVADLSLIWALIEVYSQDLPQVRVGQSVFLQIEGSVSPPIEGQVTYVYPTTSIETRTTRVRIELPNPHGDLRPGLPVNARLAGSTEPAIVVPAEAVVDTGTLQYVFVAHAGGHFEPRAVTIGTRTTTEVIVRQGVGEGEEVVSSALFVLDSESRLRATVRGMSPGHMGH